MGNILVISADTHAGLPDAEYKNYLATQYHEAFEDDLRARGAAPRLNSGIRALRSGAV